MGLWDLITEDEKSVEEVKEAEVVEEQPTEPQEQAVEQATAAQTQQEAGVDAKDASEEKQATPKKKKPAGKKGEHLYPFSIYSEGRIIDISSYGFVPGKTYKEDEITKKMKLQRSCCNINIMNSQEKWNIVSSKKITFLL